MDYEAKHIMRLLNGEAEQIYCKMGACIWKLKWNKPIKLFFLGKDFIQPSGEPFYITISVAPLNIDKPDEDLVLIKKGFLRRKAVLLASSNAALKSIALKTFVKIEKTLLSSPYVRVNVKISSFTYEELRINYKKALLITGFTNPLILFRPSVLFKKMLDANVELANLFTKFLH